MRIVIDEDVMPDGRVIAQHVIHTDVQPWNKVPHPTIAGTQIDMIVFIGLHSGNVALQKNSGYDLVNKITGDVVPRSRWARIVAACNAAPAGSPEKLLGLV
jgi:hypothetical protein